MIQPVVSTAGVPAKLIIVPDDALVGVAFAALRDEDRRYLADLTELTLMPTAASIIDPAQFPRRIEPGRTLIVGDPSFRNPEGLDLPRLPAAASEARAIARAYAGSQLLLGADATRKRILEEARHSDVIHIAAHASLSARDARNSALLLAADGPDDGILTLQEIAKTPLRHGPLVVLAGCSTGAAGGGRGAVRSLAYAFLAAGSRAVVGSLWDVEDEATQVFSTAFHRRISSGMPPAAALREAQMEMLRSPDPRLRHPAAWGAFHLYTSATGKDE